MDQAKSPKYEGVVIFVKDVEVSKRFFTGVLGQKIEMDFGRCIGFNGGFSLWDSAYAHEMMGFEKSDQQKSLPKRNAELYFEYADLDSLYTRIKKEGIDFVHEIIEQPWAQRCFRIYDPDQHIIEFAEPMDVVIQRLYNQGLTHNTIIKRTMMPSQFVEDVIGRIDSVSEDEYTEALIAPCGMNCRICIGYFGYTVSGNKRKMKCIGCRPREKSCAFLKKYCQKLSKNEINYCYECTDFPCEHLIELDDVYRKRYKMSMIENLKFIRDYGMDAFLKKQKKTYRCPECGGVICVHNEICYSCENLRTNKK